MTDVDPLKQELEEINKEAFTVSASWDQTLKVWELATGCELHKFKGHGDGVEGVALSSDGRLAVSVSKGQKTLVLWDVSSGRELRTLTRNRYWVNDVALSADGRLALSVSSREKTLKVWDVTSAHRIATFMVSASLECCIISADEKTIVAADVLGEVHFLEFSRGGKFLTPKIAYGQEEAVTRSSSLKGLRRQRHR